MVQELGYLHERTYIEAQMTKNAVMATVGDRTREQEKLLLEDSFAEQVVLEWNPGGHFADSGKRLAKGIKWLMEKRY